MFEEIKELLGVVEDDDIVLEIRRLKDMAWRYEELID